MLTWETLPKRLCPRQQYSQESQSCRPPPAVPQPWHGAGGFPLAQPVLTCTKVTLLKSEPVIQLSSSAMSMFQPSHLALALLRPSRTHPRKSCLYFVGKDYRALPVVSFCLARSWRSLAGLQAICMRGGKLPIIIKQQNNKRPRISFYRGSPGRQISIPRLPEAVPAIPRRLFAFPSGLEPGACSVPHSSAPPACAAGQSRKGFFSLSAFTEEHFLLHHPQLRAGSPTGAAGIPHSQRKEIGGEDLLGARFQPLLHIQ